MQLLPRFKKAAEQAAKDTEELEEDEEAVRGMARLFAEVGEAYTGLIATGASSFATSS